MSSFRIVGATVLTFDPGRAIIQGDVVVRHGRIVAVGQAPPTPGLTNIDGRDAYVCPGFVQAHVHLCQTLFRHRAEGRRLLDWLRDRIWPLEGAHTAETLQISGRVGIAEALLSGTTCMLDMGTVHHQDALMETLDASGIRIAAGKAMMDLGDGVPATLRETTRASLDESIALGERWHGHDDDRIRYAFAPRFALSCSLELQREVARISAERGWGIHTHAAEQVAEIEAVRALHGVGQIELLDDLGLCNERAVFAHGVHTTALDRETLARTGTTICHCPSSNLKLGSGVADVPTLLADGVRVAIGADGAPCNNGLDALVEMRLAHLLQCERSAPNALTPLQVMEMATIEGARALGWSDRIGSVEVGKDADLVLLRRDFRLGEGPDPYTEIVCSGARDMVRDVWVRGTALVRDGALTREDAARLRIDAVGALAAVERRAGLRA